jgi:hypothetical protein
MCEATELPALRLPTCINLHSNKKTISALRMNSRRPNSCHLVDEAIEFNLTQLTTREAAPFVTMPV